MPDVGGASFDGNKYINAGLMEGGRRVERVSGIRGQGIPLRNNGVQVIVPAKRVL